MPTIIAAHFQLQDETEQARAALRGSGFPDHQISTFFVNQPGQHDLTPIEGELASSAGAKDTPQGLAQGALTGGAVGAVVGAATSVLTGPVGPVVGALVGAHVGSLFSFTKMKEAGEPESGANNVSEPRRSGMLIAVAASEPGQDARAVELLRQLGAHHIERADGHIVHGVWEDFNPLSLPVLIA